MSVSYKVNRTDIFLGKELKYGEPASNSFVRLAKKDAGHWIRPVHEVWDVKDETKTLTHPLTHYSGTSVTQFVSKLDSYTDRNAAYLFEQQVRVPTWHIVAYPLGKFVQNYIFKQGFRDGTHGFLHAMFMSMHSFLTRGKLWFLWHRSNHTHSRSD